MSCLIHPISSARDTCKYIQKAVVVLVGGKWSASLKNHPFSSCLNFNRPNTLDPIRKREEGNLWFVKFYSVVWLSLLSTEQKTYGGGTTTTKYFRWIHSVFWCQCHRPSLDFLSVRHNFIRVHTCPTHAWWWSKVDISRLPLFYNFWVLNVLKDYGKAIRLWKI